MSFLDAENAAIALGWAAFFGRPEVVAVLLEGVLNPANATPMASHYSVVRWAERSVGGNGSPMPPWKIVGERRM